MGEEYLQYHIIFQSNGFKFMELALKLALTMVSHLLKAQDIMFEFLTGAGLSLFFSVCNQKPG